MKKLFLTMALLVVGLAAHAQWTKPATPTAQPLTAGAEVYLYNVDAEGFLTGGNDWGTRASVDPLHGHKIWINRLENDDVVWDGVSYFITNFIEQGGMANQVGSMFVGGLSDIWVDRETNAAAESNQGFTFVAQGGNVYKIGLSNHNQDWKGELYPEAFLGVFPHSTDTRLYFSDPNLNTNYASEDYLTRWIILTPADYASFVAAKQQYKAAVALGAALEKALAENPGIDVTSVQAVYGNTSSTAQQLEAALKQLTQLVIDFQTAHVSVDHPADYTPYIANASYDHNDNQGWSGDAPGFQTFGNAERYWGNIHHYQQLPELPAGVYRVQVTGFYRAGWNEVDAERYQASQEEEGENQWQKVKVYVSGGLWNHEKALPMHSSGASAAPIEGSTDAPQTALGYVPNNMETADLYVKAGQYAPTALYTALKAGQRLTLGLRKTETYDGDWTIWDDWRLLYYGNSDEAYRYLASEVLATTVNYEEKAEMGGDFYYQHAVYDRYAAARHALQTATTAAALETALAEHSDAYAALEKSIAAYNDYYATFSEALNWLETKEGSSDELELLMSYLYDEEETGFNGNGSGLYILNNGTLDETQLAAEKTYLTQLLNNAMANSMSDGDDCTAMLRNPNFTEEGGWTASTGVTFPTDGQPVLQGWNMVFDVNQELTGLQNGLYELTYNGLYRPAGVGEFGFEHTEAAKAFAYINNYETRIPSVLDNLSEEAVAADDANYMGQGYGPNSASGAAAHFEAGRYQAHAYGLVTDGKMKIGFKNNLRVGDNSVAWVGRARLTFRAKNAEALREVIANTEIIVERLLEAYCGQPEKDAMELAMNAALDSDDEGLYDALIALKKSVEDVEESVTAYEKFAVALFQLQQAIANNPTADEATLTKAQQVFEAHYNAFVGQTYSTAEAEEATAEMNAIVVSILFPDDEASEEHPVDYTSAIVNNNFDPTRGSKDKQTIDGWVTSAMNGYKEYTVSYNRAGFELNQKLTGLPKGKYKVTVHTYYRAGYWNEEEDRVKQGIETHLTTLYAKTSEDEFTTKVKNLYEDATDEPVDGVKCYQLGNGKYAPDGTSPTAAYFKAGYYLNELVFTVPEDGEVTIGLSKKETFANDYEVVGEWKLWYMGDKQEGLADEKDMSSLIVNNNFDPTRGSKDKQTIDGWVTSAMNGYKEYTVSYNRAGIDLYQDLSGLPEGTYKVTVHTYYRAGYWDEEETRVKNGEETHLTTFYAQTGDQTYSKPVMNLYEDAADTDLGVNCYQLGNGKYAPNGTTPTAAFFAAGYYLNELPFYVGHDGSVRIGLKKTQVLANDYEVVGEWNLYYYGSGNNVDLLTGIEDVATQSPVTAVPAGIYSINGTRLSAPQRGLNILRMADGTVRKIMVK